MTRSYRYARWVVLSDLPLSQLPPAATGSADLLRVLSRTSPIEGVRWLSQGAAGTTRGMRDEHVAFRFPGLADIVLDHTRQTVEVFAEPGADPDIVEHVVLDDALPRLLDGPRLLCLHATAVLHTAGVVGFVGPSRTGKSTIAHYLARNGLAVVADDALLVELGADVLQVVPTARGLRLRDRVEPFSQLARLYTDGVPLTSAEHSLAALILPDPDATEVRVLGVETLPALLDQVITRVHGSAAGRRSSLERVARVVDAVPVIQLPYRHDDASLCRVEGYLASSEFRTLTIAASNPRR